MSEWRYLEADQISVRQSEDPAGRILSIEHPKIAERIYDGALYDPAQDASGALLVLNGPEQAGFFYELVGKRLERRQTFRR